MEWNCDLIIKLINNYEAHPLLWDYRDKHYKFNNKKLDAWMRISESLGVPVGEVKRKMTSLLASYRRERQKCRLKRSGMGNDKAYEPSWFAYKAFSFLSKNYHPRNSNNTDEDNASPPPEECIDEGGEGEVDMENITQADEVSTETMVYPSNNVHPIKYHSPLNQRKRKALQEPRVSMAFKALKTLVDKPSSRKDRYDTYGEYLAGELRQLDEYSAAYVQKLFGDIIFDAKMGKYKEELMTYVQTTSLSHSPLASSPTTSLSQVNVTTIQQDREKFNVS